MRMNRAAESRVRGFEAMIALCAEAAGARGVMLAQKIVTHNIQSFTDFVNAPIPPSPENVIASSCLKTT
jgi:hypothetical protein